MDVDDLMREAVRQEHERIDQPLTAEEQNDPILAATWSFVRAQRRYIVEAHRLGRSCAWIAAAISKDANGVRLIYETDEARKEGEDG